MVHLDCHDVEYRDFDVNGGTFVMNKILVQLQCVYSFCLKSGCEKVGWFVFIAMVR